MAIRTGRDAVDWAKDQVTDPTPPAGEDDWFGWCLVFVRRCFNVGALYGSAEKGYYGTDFMHSATGTPPLGVPVWWTNGGDGHVVISAGQGYCYSTDIKRHGQVDKVAISYITRHWGQHYRGWSEDINGVRVWRPSAASLPSVDLSNVQEAARRDQYRPPGEGLHPHGVLTVEKALKAEELRAPQFVDGYAGPAFRSAYAKWQQRSDVGPPFDGIPGRESLTKLGNKHGFRVVS